MRPLPVALPAALGLLLSLAAGGLSAAQAVPTAAGREQEPTTAEQIDAWLKEAPPAPADPVISASRGDPASPWAEGLGGGGVATVPFVPFDAPPIVRTMADGQIHGEVGGEVGNRGYGGYAVASAPVGKNAYVQVGVSSFEGSGRGGRGYGGGYGSGFGYGSGGYGSRDRQSVNITAAWFPGRDRDEPWRRPETAPQK